MKIKREKPGSCSMIFIYLFYHPENSVHCWVGTRICGTGREQERARGTAEFRKLEGLASATRDGQERPSSRRESGAQTTDVRKVPELSSFSILGRKEGGANVIDGRSLYKNGPHLGSCLSRWPAPSLCCPWGFCQLLLGRSKPFGESCQNPLRKRVRTPTNIIIVSNIYFGIYF